MITVYLDDSGTHEESHFLTYAAVIGTAEQWAEYELRHRRLLSAPNPHRQGISEFKMHDLEMGTGEFDLWSRPERDALIHDLRSILIDIGIRGAAFSLSQQAWDTAFSAEAQIGYGTAEQACILHLMGVVSVEVDNAGGGDVALVFDTRSMEKNNEIISALKHPNRDMSVVSVSFADSARVSPIQAADMFAWEAGNLAKQYNGESFEPRAHLDRLCSSGNFRTVMFGDAAINDFAMRESINQAILIRSTDTEEIVKEKIAEATKRVFSHTPVKQARRIKRESKKSKPKPSLS